MNRRKLVFLSLFFLGLLVGCGSAVAPLGGETPTAVSTSLPARPTPTAVQPIEAYPPPGPTRDPELYPPPLAPTAVPRPTLYPAGTIEGADAEVRFVQATETAPGVWTFTVTVFHPDDGEAHYANGWDVVLPDNTVLKVNSDDPFTRLLTHPHDDEQPFTRSQAGIVVPAGTTRLYVRAHDNVHGYGNPVLIDLTTASGDRYEVERLAE